MTKRRATTFVTPVHVQRKCHISIYFLGRTSPHFVPKEKICFQEKDAIFPDNTKNIMCRHGPFWKVHLFRKFEENIIFPCIFFRKIIFVFCLRYKIIFLGKRNILFPDNTRKIIFQSNFLERLSFQNVWKKKIWFSVQCRGPKLVYKEGVEALSNYKKHYW